MVSLVLVGISDGDTLTARCGQASQDRQVRIHAIDAPERGQAFSQAARAKALPICAGKSKRQLNQSLSIKRM